MVALKFTVNDALPNVPYDTLIDVCFNSCFRSLSLIIFICVIPQYFELVEADPEVHHHFHPVQLANIVCGGGTYHYPLLRIHLLIHFFKLVSFFMVVYTTYKWFAEERIIQHLHRSDTKKVNINNIHSLTHAYSLMLTHSLMLTYLLTHAYSLIYYKVHLMENPKNFYTYRYDPAPVFLGDETMNSDPIVRTQLLTNQRAANKSIYKFVASVKK